MTDKTTMGDADAAKVTRALWNLMRSRGQGTISEVERALELRPGALRQRRRRGNFRLRDVMAVLEVLDVPAGEFFADVFGGPSSAGDRFRAQGADLLAKGYGGKLPDLARPARPDALTDDLDALDRLRFDDPRSAVDQARDVALTAAADGRHGDAAACIARMGSALRVLEQWHDAHALIAWALNHAPTDGLIMADAWRRAGSVVADYGEFDDAAALARLSVTTFAELGDVAGVARALVVRGINLRRGGRYREAIRSLRSGGALLPAEVTHGHFALRLHMGLASVGLDDLAQATSYADGAARFEAPASLTRHLPWLRARIAAAREDHTTAVRLYRETVAVFGDSPGNCALASCELCRAYLVAGRPADAVSTALTMARYAMPSATNRVVAAAIADLYRQAQAGAVSLGLVDRVRERIRRGLSRRSQPAFPRRGFELAERVGTGAEPVERRIFVAVV